MKASQRMIAPSMRAFTALLAAGLLALLAIARTLSPAVTGLGTHQQLGLPPCSMRVLFGMRCPACGMTTAWSHWTRGQWWMAAQANVGGCCLALLAVAVAVAAAQATWTGRLPSRRALTAFGWAIVGTGLVTVADWLVRLST